MNPPTPEQARVLDADAAFVPISAGAGAGKTTVLVERIWRDIEVDGIPPERILAVTFNRAAAAHLREKLQDRFSDRDAGRASHRAGLDLSASWIGTFHSLSARVVRMYPFLAGVDPEFTELDEMEAAALVEQALDDAVAATIHPGLLDALGHAVYDGGIRQAVLATHARMRSAGHRHPRITVPDAPVLPDGAVDDARRLLDDIEAHPSCNAQHRKGLFAARALLAVDVPTPKCPSISRTAQAQLKSDLIVPANDLLRAIWDHRMATFARPQLEAIAELLQRFDDLYTQRKIELGALDYDDLQFHALDVLENGVDLGVRRVYVDEFQDANAVQNRLVDAVGAERTWVVGDGAQAIYGFRHATSRFFAERIGARPGYTLSDNHRSQRPVLEALNSVFTHTLSAEPTFQHLTPAATDAPGPPLRCPPVELVSVSDPSGRTSRDQEAEVVADVVLNLLRSGYTPSDVAVLFRALTQVEPYERALRARGVPTYLVAGRGFFTHQQVADVLALLHVVDNPHHEDHLIRVLASPYVGAGDDDLVSLRQHAGPREPLWPAVPWIPALGGIVDIVARLRPVLRERGLPALVEAATAANGYDLAVLGLDDGRRRFANLRRLVRMAEAFAEVRGPDLPGFLAALSDHERLGQDPGEAVVVDPELSAVRLTTIHAVKGQEFPAVVLADGSHGMPTGQHAVLVDEDGAAGFRARIAGGDAADLFGVAALAEAAKADAAAEERRVFYVALTRAQRHVTVVGRPDGRGGDHCMYALMRDAVAAGATAADISVTPSPVSVPDRLPPPAAPATTPVPLPAPAPPLAADPVAGRRLSFSALSRFAMCPLRFHLESERGLAGRPEDRVPDPSQVGPGGGGAVVGSLVHVWLERHMWRAGAAPDDSAASAAGWAVAMARSFGRDDLDPLHAERAEAIVRGVLASPVALRIATARSVHTERPFAIVVDGVLLTGSIDLHAELPNGTHLLVDWKTHLLGDRAPEDVASEYRLQGSLYGLAALRAGAPSVELAWVFTDALDRPQVRTVSPGDSAALEDEIRATLAGLAAPDRPPGFSRLMPHCSGCPGLRGSCPVAVAFAA